MKKIDLKNNLINRKLKKCVVGSLLFLILFVAIQALSADLCQAQETAKAVTDSLARRIDPNLEKRPATKFFLDKFEILGRIQKPQTVFIIPGQDPTIGDIQIDRSFFREIFRSMERDEIRKNIKARRQSKVSK